jgi:hypothetical protein
MSDQVADFVRRLASTSPDLVDVYRQHLADQGELLPHVLLGDITRVVVTASTRGEQVDWLPGFLQQLEAGLVSGDDDVAELVAVSFVENLSGENAAIRNLVPSMGEMLRREVKAICGV